MTSLGMIVIDFGVSTMVSVNFDDAEWSTLNGAAASANGFAPAWAAVMTISSPVSAAASAASAAAACAGAAARSATASGARSEIGRRTGDIGFP